MSSGTLTRLPTETTAATADVSTKHLRLKDNEPVAVGDISANHVLEPLEYGMPPAHIVSAAERVVHDYLSRHKMTNWREIVDETVQRGKTVWDADKLQSMLMQPVGMPVDLTREEAEEIVRLAFGRRPDLESGKSFVESVREILGHSLLERLKDAEG